MNQKFKDRLAILLHSDPDLDCIGSAYAVRDIFRDKFKEVVIVGKLRYNYSWLVDEGDIVEDIPEGWLGGIYQVALVDIGNPERLTKLQSDMLKEAFFVQIFDHHIFDKEKWTEAVGGRKHSLSWCVGSNFDSCCEFLWKDGLLDNGRAKVTQKSLTALLAGIYAESNCFRDTRGETFKVVADLIAKGADMELVVKNCNKTIATWPKLKYLAKVIQSERRYKDEGVIVLYSWYSDYLQHNFNLTRHRVRKAPIYVLSMLRRENIKFKENMNAYLLFYDRQDKSKKNITIVLELIRWSKKRQEALSELGFDTFKERQYRYYMDAHEDKCDEIAEKIFKALMDTNTQDLEFI